MNTQIRVITQDNNVVYLDLENDQPITANYQFKDIQDFKSTKGNHTYNFRIPSTANNNNFFNFYFKVTQYGNFDPKKKVKASILKNTFEVFDGYLQLTNVIRSNNKPTFYECVVFSSVSSIGQVLKGKYLNQFDWSAYVHAKSLTNVTQSFLGNLFSGDIIYSLYDYGSSPMYGGELEGRITDPDVPYNVNALRPQIKVKKVLDTIIEQSGFTYESTFFSDNESKLYVDVNNGGEGTNNLVWDYYKVFVEATGGQTLSANELKVDIVNNDIISQYYTNDASLYNTNTGVYSMPLSPFQFVLADCELTITTTASSSTSVDAPLTGKSISISLVKIGTSQSPETIVAESRPIRLTKWMQDLYGTGYRHVERIYFPEQLIEGDAGDYKFVLNIYGELTSTAQTGGTITISHGQTSFKPKTGFVSNRYLEDYNATQTFDLSYNFSNIKAIDFLTSLAKKFNLVIVPDDLNKSHLLIEPYKDWIGQGNDVDWSSKLDHSKDIQYKPTADLQSKELTFSDAESDDNLNSQFKKTTQRVYGSQIIDNDENDFAKNNEEVRTIFKPVITTYIPYTGIRYSVCYEGEGDSIKNTEGMRLSYYSGNRQSDIEGETITMTDGNSTTTPIVIDYFPLFQNYEDYEIDTDTKCLTFAGENTGSLNVPVSFNSAYSVYWRSYLDEIYSRDSRILIGHFNLTSADINQMQFNDIVFVHDSFYRINRVMNYSLVGDELTKVELIKVEVSNVLDADGNECLVEPIAYNNNFVIFANKESGALETPTQECCEAYGFEYNASNGGCWGKTKTPTDITLPAVQTFTPTGLNVSSTTGLYTFYNGVLNSGSDFSMINGTGNQVRPAPKNIKINGSRNVVKGQVNNSEIDGNSNVIEPYQISASFNDIDVNAKQEFRNVKIKGDHGFAIASNSEFKTSAKVDIITNEVENVSGRGRIISSAKILGQSKKLIGQDGDFDENTSSIQERLNNQANNFIRIPYPSLLRGEVKVQGSPNNVDYYDQFAEETYQIEVNNQSPQLNPITSISSISGKSNSTANFNNLDVNIKSALATMYTDSKGDLQPVCDGMFAIEIDQTTMPNMGNVNYNIEIDYTLIKDGLQSRSPFNPTDMTTATCKLWLDATDRSSFTFSSGDNITHWDDKANFFSGVQFSNFGTDYPEYTTIDGVNPAVYFENNDILRTTNSSVYGLPNNNNTQIFAVFKGDTRTNPSPPAGENIVGTSYFSSLNTYGLVRDASQNGAGGIGSTTFIQQPSGSTGYSASLTNISSTTLQAVNGFRNGSTQSIEDQDGNTASNTSAGTFVFANQMSIGGIRSTSTGNIINTWKGWICEIIMFDGVLNNTETQNVMNYLKGKWNTIG